MRRSFWRGGAFALSFWEQTFRAGAWSWEWTALLRSEEVEARSQDRNIRDE